MAIIEAIIEIIIKNGDFNAEGGVAPKSKSRKIPPPTAVITDITSTPKTSNLWLIPTTVPEMANATVPKISKNK
jgi:hypothetical protein